ncbi:MAG: hypothetical protein HZA46_08795 [Planctomycetales bacterium]|nr:hypothetical protein [Planctomycetales bacterium]
MEKSISVRQVNDPVQVANACRKFLDAVERDEYEGWSDEPERYAFRQFLASLNQGLGRTFLVCNGGNKLTPVGLLQGWANLHPVVLYGDDSPAVCWTFPQGLEQSPYIRPYQRDTLDLPDILTTSGHFLLNQGAAERFWPGPIPPDLVREPYGKIEEYTRYLHSQHFEWAVIQAGKELPGYDALSHLVDLERVERWKRAFVPLISAGARSKGKDFDEVMHSLSPGTLSPIYFATINLAQDGARSRDRRDKSPPEAKISDAFERAVAARVHAWLDRVGHPAVQSAWRNVEVARRGQTEPMAQFDVLLVLKNGIIWHLECKSATVELKDLDARILNLQQAGSQLARMAVCVPILTQYATEPWFERLQTLRHRIEGSRIPFVSFTLPNQPATYSWPDENGTPVVRDCPSLEAKLDFFLKQYEPRG